MEQTSPDDEPKNNSRIVLKVEEDTVPSPPRLPLSDNDSGHNLLPELGLTLLDGSVEMCNDRQDMSPICTLQGRCWAGQKGKNSTHAMTMSPAEAAGSLFSLAPNPMTEMT